MKAVKFKNFTKEDFTWNWDGIPHEFKAGQEIYLEDDKAAHFAKHLADREMNNAGIPTNNAVARRELEDKCYVTEPEVSVAEALNLNQKAAVKKGKKAEKEFEDLEDNNK